MSNLLSGFLGALIATLLTIFYQIYAQKMRISAEITIKVIEWIENIYFLLQDLQVQAEGVYKYNKEYLSQEDYNAKCRELRNKLLSSKLEVHLSLIYGESSKEVQVFNSLKSKLTEASSILIDAKKNNWTETEQKIMNLFSNDIDPQHHQIKEMLMQKVSSRIFLYYDIHR